MPKALLIFPDQLVRATSTYPKDTVFYIIEDARFFRSFRFHKQKLVFHRASMQAFRERLLIKGYAVHYFDTIEYRTLASVLKYIKSSGVQELSYFSIITHTIRKDLIQQAKIAGIVLNEEDANLFLYPNLPVKLPSESASYVLMRQEFNLLLDGALPRGGVWEHKPDEIQQITHIDSIPLPPVLEPDRYIEDATHYVMSHFSRNPGNVEPLHFPITYADSQDWLESFLDDRLVPYATHNQAFHCDGSLLYYPALSVLLNVGLLTPVEVITQASERLRNCLVPLASVERLYRKVVGTREYMRAQYQQLPGDSQAVSVPRMLLEGKTGILPVDTVIGRLIETGYANDMERRHILGGFAILLELPVELTVSWLASLTIDATIWSLYPSVLQLYENPKAVLLSSQKLRAMSGYESGEWTELWDALHTRYNDVHSGNGIALRPFGRATSARAESYIHTLSGQVSKKNS